MAGLISLCIFELIGRVHKTNSPAARDWVMSILQSRSFSVTRSSTAKRLQIDMLQQAGVNVQQSSKYRHKPI
jgi:hypothetical protein